MKRQVERTICDIKEPTVGLSSSGPCSNEAEAKCCLCQIDVCFEHVVRFSQEQRFGGGDREKPYKIIFCPRCFRERVTDEGFFGEESPGRPRQRLGMCGTKHLYQDKGYGDQLCTPCGHVEGGNCHEERS